MKEYLEQVAYNATQMNADERTQLLRFLEYFKYLFDGTLGDWYTYHVDLELKSYYKPFHCKYYPVAINSKETFCKNLKQLVKWDY